MQDDLPKAAKKKLAELVMAAHEKALRLELSKLSEHVDQWRRGEIDTFELADRIHKFEEGPARKIYKQFTWSRNADLPMLVAHAIVSGLIERNAVPEEIMPHIRRWLAFDESR